MSGSQKLNKRTMVKEQHHGPKGAKHLSANNFPNLTKLNLVGNNIGAKGARYLSANNFPNLTELNLLWYNNIGVKGASYIQAPNFPNLIKLSLHFNSLTKHTSDCYLTKKI